MKPKFIFKTKSNTKTDIKRSDCKLVHISDHVKEEEEVKPKPTMTFKTPAKEPVVEIPDAPDYDNMSLKEMEALLVNKEEAVAESKGEATSKIIPNPPKPPKKKSTMKRRHTSGPVIPFDEWNPLIDKVFQDEPLMVHTDRDADRIDITPEDALGEKSWRICILAFVGKEFFVSLYYDYQPGFNVKAIKLEAMPYSLLEKSIKFLYDNRETFFETVIDDTLGED